MMTPGADMVEDSIATKLAEDKVCMEKVNVATNAKVWGSSIVKHGDAKASG
jgi:hypothetical protein